MGVAKRPIPPQNTPQTPQTAPAPDEILACRTGRRSLSTAEMVQRGVFEVEYGFESGQRTPEHHMALEWELSRTSKAVVSEHPLESDAGTAGLGTLGRASSTN